MRYIALKENDETYSVDSERRANRRRLKMFEK